MLDSNILGVQTDLKLSLKSRATINYPTDYYFQFPQSTLNAFTSCNVEYIYIYIYNVVKYAHRIMSTSWRYGNLFGIC